MEYLKIPNDRKIEFIGNARYYYVVEFDVPSKGYTGRTMVPSDVELDEDQIFSKAQEFLKNHFKEVFGKYSFVAELSIPEAYDTTLK
jgi:hypothetical protein